MRGREFCLIIPGGSEFSSGIWVSAALPTKRSPEGVRCALDLHTEAVCGINHRIPRLCFLVNGLLVCKDSDDGDGVLRVEADASFELSTHLPRRVHRLESHPRCWRSLGGSVVGGSRNGGGKRAVEERAIVDFEAAEQEQGGLHPLLALWHGEVNCEPAVERSEAGKRGSDLDSLAKPVGVSGGGENGVEEGLLSQRRCLDKL
eukprot:scaffold33581_cov62-Phaeocystis_antarctica.AAC.3